MVIGQAVVSSGFILTSFDFESRKIRKINKDRDTSHTANTLSILLKNIKIGLWLDSKILSHRLLIFRAQNYINLQFRYDTKTNINDKKINCRVL